MTLCLPSLKTFIIYRLMLVFSSFLFQRLFLRSNEITLTWSTLLSNQFNHFLSTIFSNDLIIMFVIRDAGVNWVDSESGVSSGIGLVLANSHSSGTHSCFDDILRIFVIVGAKIVEKSVLLTVFQGW